MSEVSWTFHFKSMNYLRAFVSCGIKMHSLVTVSHRGTQILMTKHYDLEDFIDSVNKLSTVFFFFFS